MWHEEDASTRPVRSADGSAGADERLFQSVVRRPSDDAAEDTGLIAESPGEGAEIDQLWSVEAIEEAYRRALEIESDALADASVPIPPAMVEEQVVAEAGGNAPPQVESPSLTTGQPRPIQPRQVLEALLFVGGESLTVKRMSDVLGGGLSHESVEELLGDLNRQYLDENRPYEIRLGEGGYALTLRNEYDRIRSRVFGQGPKDVKLSQDVLEVLALVAYRQPVTKEQVEATGKPNATGLLRQLLRRELVALERGEMKDDVTYRTTPRFLQLFGLGSLRDLPLPEDFSFK